MEKEANTFLNQLDPRTKIAGLIVFGILIFLGNSWWILLATACVVFGGIIASPISLREAFRQIRRVLWFSLFIITVNALTLSGDVLWMFKGIYVTEEGLVQGLVLSAKLSLLLLLSFLFARTTGVAQIVDAAETALSPFRKHFGGIISTVSITLNFIPVLVQSAQRIKAAQIARGADIDSTFFGQIRFASAAALPLFVNAFRSAQHLADAMDARCYDATVGRTPFTRQTLKVWDWVVILFMTGFAFFAVLPSSLEFFN